MPVILTWNSSGDGGSSYFSNANTLKKLSESLDGKLFFNGKTVNSQDFEVTYYETIKENQTFIELPNNCDTTQAITVSLNGISFEQGTFWEVREKNNPEKDLIAWDGLELEDLAQEGDKIMITYYRKE